jgi:hypothetical protein
LKSERIEAIDEALFSGVVGLSAIFFSLKDLFSADNRINFVILISVYATATMIRIFGIILESISLKELCIHYCRIILVPFTLWSFITILFTEMHLVMAGTFLSFYIFLCAEYFILRDCYGIRLKVRLPIQISINGKETKSIKKKPS